ncbi:probable phosphorylase b kinase regulatory subunit beta isoform X1 [Ixodes scapularis]|uniref:probable phosphorylase b kinase regulatory subunit beta isoform X1 n=1 Tax=Ixodes scapularis TaxID=6945 RepID=UPI001C38D43A|nr:probable phosphorylase b kinase regulatory subunit beta isoform X1 [Ixodes scapularis]
MAVPLFGRSRVNSVSDAVDVDSIKLTNYTDTVQHLDKFYGQVKRQLLNFQSPTTGLFPRLSRDREHGYVRDSIYCAVSIWSLYQAYKRIDDDRGKSYELGQSVVKCMRGILFCWMRQSKDKMEKFKVEQGPQHALHSIFHLKSGMTIIPESDYGHLQIDSVSLYLLYLVQMITSGLQIIYTMDEVNFVQNLVYYVERAYRTPDFGMWERGSKYNNGTPEIHSSSIGMAKSALEAINGCNLFGDKGASWSVIYVDVDAHNRNRSIFETLLPRESSSKNTDTGLLMAVSFPCFATHDDYLYRRTKDKVIRKLHRSSYGIKRFLRDGYGTVLEDRSRKYYTSGETKAFENIESEWPMFFILMILDGIFKGHDEQVQKYKQLLAPRLKRDKYGGNTDWSKEVLKEWEDYIVPMYFYVPKEFLEAERAEPGSQPRLPSAEGDVDNLFMMGQALHIISKLLLEGLLHITELDPVRRYLPSCNRPRRTDRYSAFQGKAVSAATDLVVQVVLIAESMRLQAMMATYGIQTQTPHEVEPVQIWSPKQLMKVYEFLGVNRKLGLKGRPRRPIGALGTSKLYRICGQTVLCYPLIFEVNDFYLSHDMALLIDDIKNELTFVGKYWRMSGRPTMAIVIREDNMRDSHFKELLDLLAMLKKGHCDGLKVRMGRLQNLISSSCIEHLDFLHLLPHDALPKFEAFQQLEHTNTGYQSLTDVPKAIAYSEPSYDYSSFYSKPNNEIIEALSHVDTLHGQSQLLGILWHRVSPNFTIDGVMLKDRLEKLTRQAGALKHWAVVRHCSSILGKVVDSLSPYITAILVNGKQITVGVFGRDEAVIDKPLTPKEIKSIIYTQCKDHVYHAVLLQEVIVYVGRLVSTTPKLFEGILKIRTGSVIHAMNLYLKFTSDNPPALESLSPSELRKVVYQVFTLRDNADIRMSQHCTRQIEGALCRVPKDFFDRVWDVMTRTPGGIVVGGHHLPQQPTLSELTIYDLNFALQVEMLLSHISLPEYRHVMIELLMVIDVILKRNPEFSFSDKVDLDVLIRDAFAMFKAEKESPGSDPNNVTSFYDSPSSVTSCYLSRGIMTRLLTSGIGISTEECSIS